jgi:hypothetical protein
MIKPAHANTMNLTSFAAEKVKMAQKAAAIPHPTIAVFCCQFVGLCEKETMHTISEPVAVWHGLPNSLLWPPPSRGSPNMFWVVVMSTTTQHASCFPDRTAHRRFRYKIFRTKHQKSKK